MEILVSLLLTVLANLDDGLFTPQSFEASAFNKLGVNDGIGLWLYGLRGDVVMISASCRSLLVWSFLVGLFDKPLVVVTVEMLPSPNHRKV